jgi:hypothetical protein
MKNEPNQKLNRSRRKALKVMGVSVLGLGASFVLPADWTKPVARFGVLPAHAQVSPCQDNFISSPASLTVFGLVEQPGDDVDGINFHFDGCSFLRMSEGDEADYTNPDFILFLDVDSADGETFDIEIGPVPGSPWSIVSTSWTPTGSYGAAIDLPEGTDFVIRLSKDSGLNAGAVFDVSFDVAVDPVTNGYSMTVSNLRATLVP